ncbi:4-hydroxythreonine-4-phosphate dehydrogenase PdxA [Schlegelella sp. S2-27]|uniref:4-hydroxythreonine-4-phosphate dehydrogenase PdxA n=1 Tax=Caldimonas mangrovi TaxID=2944811 RepID=A0ABT0YPN9_9BURK|nr:4-hydroxythreonine-4-phosphate dehydrogenase PdxA [Caldimonas mangrovi]MCM5680709.1 4-hydroxythreonine-4-phosphate dehydrogenase PdxA [Caldimonas mangrovi]
MSAPLRRPLALTMGDPAGIGPEIVAQAYRLGVARNTVVLGDVAVLRRAAQCTGGMLPVAVLERAEDVAHVPPACIPVVPVVDLPELPAFGVVDARAGAAAHACIRRAAEMAVAGEVSGVVTAPIHKEALAASGVHFPGHTEMLQAYAGAPDVRMMLANDELKTVLVTIHMSLRQAIEGVSFDSVLQTLRIAHRSAALWGQPQPRIAVAGLNPHAGEGGLFGDEEQRVIRPAVEAAQAEGIDARGPYAPDTVFMRARNTLEHPGEFDLVVAMYHDQGLIPVKYLGVERGVNVTLGLPFVRTSPDHGTAFDLAGTGRADPASLMAAIEMARRLGMGAGR